MTAGKMPTLLSDTHPDKQKVKEEEDKFKAIKHLKQK